MIVETLLLAVYQELKENCYHKVKPYLLIHDNIGGLRAGLFVALCFYANACNYNVSKILLFILLIFNLYF